ncbi:MAG: response regulator [Polyangiaceae bacterium]
MTPNLPLPPRYLRVLLVEDNVGDAELVQDHLALVDGLEVELTHVTRLQAALDALGQGSFHAVLLDLGLPDSLGVETIRRILKQHPEIPVVVLTGLDDQGVGLHALHEGAQDYLDKGSLDGKTAAKSLVYAIERARLQADIRRVIVENVDAMVVVAADQRVVFVNHAAADLFGIEPEAFVGTTFPHSLDTQQTSEIEIARNVGSDPRVAQMRVARVEWESKPAFLASLRDITDLRRAQELERRLFHADRLAAVGQLAAGVAHEVNNPASFVQANLGSLRDHLAALERCHAALKRALDDLDPPAAEIETILAEYQLGTRLGEMSEMVADSLAGVRRVSSTVKDLASFSRIERGDVEMVNLNDLVRVACNMTFNEIRHRAQLVKDLDRLPEIAADRGKVTQVLINLLINAAHAIPEGGADHHRIRIETRHRDHSVIVSVEDTGSGIAESDIPRIFEPFFTTKSRDHGTGLGLSISHETVRKHGGGIVVNSTVGEGTRFDVVFPEDTGLQPSTSTRRKTGIPSPAQTRRGRVLLIDDEAMLRKAVHRVLQTQHDVIEASDGQEGLDILAGDPSFDVIICDLMMPGLDGPGVYDALQKRSPELLERLVFLTGGAFSDRTKAFIASAQPIVVEKPVSNDLLRGIVQRLVRARD